MSNLGIINVGRLIFIPDFRLTWAVIAETSGANELHLRRSMKISKAQGNVEDDINEYGVEAVGK